MLVLRYSRIQASASPGNTRVAPHQLVSDLVVASHLVKQNLQGRIMSRKIFILRQSRTASQDVRATLWKLTAQSAKNFTFRGGAYLLARVQLLLLSLSSLSSLLSLPLSLPLPLFIT